MKANRPRALKSIDPDSLLALGAMISSLRSTLAVEVEIGPARVKKMGCEEGLMVRRSRWQYRVTIWSTIALPLGIIYQ